MNCLETPNSRDLHNVAGDGKRDGSRSVADWAISSESSDGAANCGKSDARSTISGMSANNNSRHERRTTYVDDMISSHRESVRPGIKSPGLLNNVDNSDEDMGTHGYYRRSFRSCIIRYSDVQCYNRSRTIIVGLVSSKRLDQTLINRKNCSRSSQMNCGSHNIAGNGKCDGPKNSANDASILDAHGITSSRASGGTVTNGRSDEGSETRVCEPAITTPRASGTMFSQLQLALQIARIKSRGL